MSADENRFRCLVVGGTSARAEKAKHYTLRGRERDLSSIVHAEL